MKNNEIGNYLRRGIVRLKQSTGQRKKNSKYKEQRKIKNRR
jgi:hypothetical protein